MMFTVLEPSLYAKARLPLEQAESLPPWCYTSQQFYDEEVSRIFRKTWNFVGREDEIPTAGDFFTVDLFGESIIIVRDRASKVHAFANTCRHRGTRLLTGSGRCPAIRCPYHSWTYALSGDLISTPGMEGVVGFQKADYGLIPVRMESWGGFMFLTLDPDCVPLSQYLGNAIETFAPYRFENMRCTRRKEYDLACNWKIYIENAMEDYHTATVHHVSIGKQVCTREPAAGNWDAIHMPAEKTSALLPGETTPFPHIATLTGKSAAGTYFSVIYPNMFFATTQDCMWWLHAAPKGPSRCLVTHGACFPRETVERDDFKEEARKYYQRWDKSLPEDNRIAEMQQAGLESSLSQPGRLSLHEPVVHAIDQWVLDKLLHGSPAQRSNCRQAR
jgi:phenylpropionate dioxygenase-like ring-hydroxylating dioxygenase large terminal subunit